MGPGADGDDRSQGDLDRARLEALAQRLEQPVVVVARTLRDELVSALGQIDAGLRAEDLAAVGHGAHAARNTVLMIGTEAFLDRLRALESAADRDALDDARRARAQIAGRARRLVAALVAVG